MPGAVDWYRLSVNAPLSNPAYEWRTRSALLAGDWTMVRWSIEQMPPTLRNQPAWIYWHARSLKQAGDTAAANQEFTGIAISSTSTVSWHLKNSARRSRCRRARKSLTPKLPRLRRCRFCAVAEVLRDEPPARRQPRMELAACVP